MYNVLSVEDITLKTVYSINLWSIAVLESWLSPVLLCELGQIIVLAVDIGLAVGIRFQKLEPGVRGVQFQKRDRSKFNWVTRESWECVGDCLLFTKNLLFFPTPSSFSSLTFSLPPCPPPPPLLLLRHYHHHHRHPHLHHHTARSLSHSSVSRHLGLATWQSQSQRNVSRSALSPSSGCTRIMTSPSLTLSRW